MTRILLKVLFGLYATFVVLLAIVVYLTSGARIEGMGGLVLIAPHMLVHLAGMPASWPLAEVWSTSPSYVLTRWIPVVLNLLILGGLAFLPIKKKEAIRPS